MSTLQSGALPDTRSEEEKLKDFQQREIVASAAPVNWVEKPQSEWRKFPIFNQDGSGSCVAQSEAKEMGIMRWLKDKVYVHFSATHIYQQRSNRPAPGMEATDARKIISAKGATLEVLTPSQNMTDAQMDSTVVDQYKKDVGAVFAVPNYLAIPPKSVEDVAATIQATGKGVMVWFYFKIDEWTDRPKIKYPNLDKNAADTIRHSVCAVDFFLSKGKKCILIEDSWGSSFGLAGQRVIEEDFFKVRGWYTSYLMNFKFDGNVVKPVHTFNLDMQFGDTNNEVKALQDCLKYEGLFPSNADSTGYFGAITKKAVQQFQVKYGISSAASPAFGRCGPMTRTKLNQIYSA